MKGRLKIGNHSFSKGLYSTAQVMVVVVVVVVVVLVFTVLVVILIVPFRFPGGSPTRIQLKLVGTVCYASMQKPLHV